MEYAYLNSESSLPTPNWNLNSPDNITAIYKHASSIKIQNDENDSSKNWIRMPKKAKPKTNKKVQMKNVQGR